MIFIRVHTTYITLKCRKYCIQYLRISSESRLKIKDILFGVPLAYSLQYSGTQLSLKDLLKTTARGLQIMFFNSLSIVEVITSKPGEVIGFILSIFLIMSSSSKRVVKDVRQGKSFQKYTHIQYCSVLSLGANVNTRRMSKPDMGSIIHIKNQ